MLLLRTKRSSWTSIFLAKQSILFSLRVEAVPILTVPSFIAVGLVPRTQHAAGATAHNNVCRVPLLGLTPSSVQTGFTILVILLAALTIVPTKYR